MWILAESQISVSLRCNWQNWLRIQKRACFIEHLIQPTTQHTYKIHHSAFILQPTAYTTKYRHRIHKYHIHTTQHNTHQFICYSTNSILTAYHPIIYMYVHKHNTLHTQTWWTHTQIYNGHTQNTTQQEQTYVAEFCNQKSDGRETTPR